jgi:probable phosphoglycerate mutase
MTRLVLVRHGQTEWNRVERFRGRADVPLNDLGRAQAEATGRRIAAEWQPNAIYSSPLSRSLKTAEAIAQPHGLEVQIHVGVAGDCRRLVRAPHTARIPSGEPLADLRARAMQTVQELAVRHPEQTIVLVGHTVINRVILLGLGNERFWRLKQDTCAINVFEAERDDFILISLNDTCYLRDVNGT